VNPRATSAAAVTSTAVFRGGSGGGRPTKMTRRYVLLCFRFRRSNGKLVPFACLLVGLLACLLACSALHLGLYRAMELSSVLNVARYTLFCALPGCCCCWRSSRVRVEQRNSTSNDANLLHIIIVMPFGVKTLSL
jgi:hypothetical protein